MTTKDKLGDDPWAESSRTGVKGLGLGGRPESVMLSCLYDETRWLHWPWNSARRWAPQETR